MSTHKLVGGGLFLFFLYCVIDFLLVEHVAKIFWYCNLVLLFAAIGIWTKNVRFMQALLIQAIVLQISWVYDATTFLLYGEGALGFVDSMFSGFYPTSTFIAWLEHFITIPALLLIIRKEKLVVTLKEAVGVGAVVFVLVQSISIMIYSPYPNLNCAFEPCFGYMPATLPLVVHQLVFFLEVMVGISIVWFIFSKVWKHIKPISTTVVCFFVISALFFSGAFITGPHYTVEVEGIESFVEKYNADTSVLTLRLASKQCVVLISSIESKQVRGNSLVRIRIDPEVDTRLGVTTCSNEV